MTNKAIAKTLRKTAKLMELAGENKFKVRAYEKAARAIRGFPEPLEPHLEQGELPEINGVGKGIAAALKELNKNGELTKLTELREKIPPGVVELSEVNGLGASKLRTLWKDGGITSPEELIEAAEANKLVELKGFGAKTQATIYNAVMYHNRNRHKLHLSTALAATERLQQVLDDLDVVDNHSPVGELRRHCPTIEQLQWLVSVAEDKRTKLIEALASADFSPDGEAPVELELEEAAKLHLFICTRAEFPRQLFELTTEGQHFDYFQDVLSEELSEEAEIYAKKQLPFIVPELRENTVELDLAQQDALPELLKISDLKGVLHAHSTYSDGAFSLREMAEACIERGYEYLGITDHSQSAFYADGLNSERVQEQWAEIDELNSEFDSFRIFKGIESDILTDGSLDYSDEILAGFDFIIGSIHSGFKMSEEQATQRLISAIKNPYLTILGHPTGRLLLNREGYSIDHQRIIDAAAEHGVVIELNSNPWRLDIDWTWLRYMDERGVKTAICPDAHSKVGIDDMRYGVMVGRKGFLTAEQTLNTLSTDELEDYFKKRRP
ncbi:MAG: PHP domain-containing protein [Bacteroidota bacterium]